MKEDILSKILAQQEKNGETMSRIEALLELALLRDAYPKKDDILQIAEEGGLDKLHDAKSTIGFLRENYEKGAKERHEEWYRKNLQDFENDWAIVGQIECYAAWDKSNDPNKREYKKSIYRGDIKMAKMKEILLTEFAAPKNQTDLNRKLTSQVRCYIKQGKLPDEGVFKKIKNSQVGTSDRKFPSRETLSKNDFFRFWMIYLFTWGYRSKPEGISVK